MPLAQPIVDFLVAWESLGRRCDRHPWGTVTADGRFPNVWDANRALIAGAVTPSFETVRAALEDARRESGVSFDQVELVDVEAHAPLYSELVAQHGAPERFALMVAEGGDIAEQATEAIRVDERGVPAPELWRELKAATHADEEPLPDGVAEQLCDRDDVVFFPAGKRLFVGERLGEAAGIATYSALRSVGLVDDVSTVPRHRRQGVAAALMRHIARVSRDAGDVAVFLFAAEDGDPQRLYGRLGFRQVAVSAQFHSDLATG